MDKKNLNKSEMILVALYKLYQQKNTRITLEDVAVKAWELYPKDFCMRGYPQFPNVDIPKYITKLLDRGLVTGSVASYKITPKGVEQAEILAKGKQDQKGRDSKEQPRHIKTEISRLVSSKVFKYYIKDKEIDFVQSDLFDFLGTSPRSFTSKDRTFNERYNTVVKEVIPFCKKIKNNDNDAKIILELWKKLSEKFGDILARK